MRRPVYGYEGLYEVDISGNVYGVDRAVRCVHGAQRVVRGIVMKLCTDIRGYLFVGLSNGDSRRKLRVHRIVMMSFFPFDGMEKLDVNHRDGNRQNNHITNLEWCTRSENHLHAFRELGKQSPWKGKFGADHHYSIPVVGLCKKTGAEVAKFDSISSAGRGGYCISHISSCLSGNRKSHKGLLWERAVH